MRVSPKAVRFDDDTLWMSLSDGRTIAAPLAWFPRLLEKKHSPSSSTLRKYAQACGKKLVLQMLTLLK